ncbi:hypothetical protein [Novosphingobium sp. FKTRR1]|uniref:hypothetical protein n=1 Tax=Novosphingobium sp. FKTRR1 TaxID=2879118 RepID=UPI001CEFCDB6|nr:hypothetical protein [Novosphingobium sp. FKTRR1]
MTAPNRSTAVMQRRATTAPDELDYFPTPPWATRALCRFLSDEGGEPVEVQRAWEPACGEGHMVRPLREYFADVHASDVHPYTPGQAHCDFLIDLPGLPVADWIITNPPFNIGDQFAQTAMARARRGVALFVRSAFAEGAERYRSLFTEAARPTWELAFCERVVLLKGRLIRSGAPDPFNLDEHGKPKKASSATSYSWLIWQIGRHDTRKRWIAPAHAPRSNAPAIIPTTATCLAPPKDHCCEPPRHPRHA